MTIYDDSPHYWINSWVENRLRGIKELNGSIVPASAVIPAKALYVTDVDTNDKFEDATSIQAIPLFSPGGQQPETLTVYNSTTNVYNQLPIATYTIMQQKVTDQPWLICGQVTYTFYFGNVEKLFEISHCVQDLTKREDWSAYDLNWFFRNDATYPFEMKNISFLNSAGPIPAKDEGGFSNLVISIGYDCTYEGKNRVGEYGDETERGVWI
jgi:hypothetical protein